MLIDPSFYVQLSGESGYRMRKRSAWTTGNFLFVSVGQFALTVFSFEMKAISISTVQIRLIHFYRWPSLPRFSSFFVCVLSHGTFFHLWEKHASITLRTRVQSTSTSFGNLILNLSFSFPFFPQTSPLVLFSYPFHLVVWVVFYFMLFDPELWCFLLSSYVPFGF